MWQLIESVFVYMYAEFLHVSFHNQNLFDFIAHIY